MRTFAVSFLGLLQSVLAAREYLRVNFTLTFVPRFATSIVRYRAVTYVLLHVTERFACRYK